MRAHYYLYGLVFWGIASCQNINQQSHGAIVLGDSTAIITETNPEYLADFVPDINNHPHHQDTVTANIPPADTIAVAEEKKADTFRTTAKINTDVLPKNGKGLTVEFSEITVFIPNIDTRSFKNQNVKSLNGVSYQLSSGTLRGNQLVIKGGNVQKVSQRYISTYVVSKDGKSLALENMDETTAWKAVKGNKGIYPITGIEPSKLAAKKTNTGAIRTAVSRTARAERMSRSEIKEWEGLVKNLKRLDQEPVNVALQSIMWRIEGKDAKGKSFSKEVRIDVPL